jgi:phosphoglycolate phosphatase-like HAD superfamily hydrolase
VARPAAILDIDGTLVDTNYHHAVSWWRAFAQHEVIVPLWRIHRSIGMGGDQLVPALAGHDVDEDCGEEIRAAEKALYMAVIGEVVALPGAADLPRALKDRGHEVVLSSSAKDDEVDHYLDLLGVRDVIDGHTTSADVEATKPEPDVVKAALAKVTAKDAVMIGDSVYDCEAAARASLPSIGLLTGGFGEDELRKAGASAVFESIDALREGLGKTPLSA